MTDELLFPSHNWLPELGYFIVSVALLIGLYYFRRIIIKIDCLWADVLFYIIMLIISIAQYLAFSYKKINYHGIGIGAMKYLALDDYDSLQFGWLIFVLIQSLLVIGVGRKK